MAKQIISLQEKYPLIAQEWDYENNNDFTPHDVPVGSNILASWICPKGHRWKAKISNRVYNENSCPYCSGRYAISGENDLMTVNPQLAEEWNYEKNKECIPSKIKPNSNIKVWWRCKEGHEWQAQVNSRSKGNGCPYCANKKVLSGYNDLASNKPELLPEWDYEKNIIQPTEVTCKSEKKVWWRCEYGHSYQTSICIRVNGHGCPICNKGLQTSFAEQAVFFYVKKICKDAINNCRSAINDKELDIYIPSKKIGIEYDGEKWHSSKNKDEEKNILCAKAGITLYRIRERACWFWSDSKYLIQIPCSAYNYSELNNAITVLLMDITDNLYSYDVNVKRDEGLIREQYMKYKKSNNLTVTNPEIAELWDYQKNASIQPESVKAGSDLKFWWKGACGHGWQASVSNMVKGKLCPYCAGKKVLIGFNDLGTVKPELVTEWNYDKNGTLTPEMVTKGCNKKVWWKCVRGHEWQAQINSRVRGLGCPYCSNKKVLAGYNDFATTHPWLLKEWDWEKNSSINPHDFSKGSHEKVWWKCSKGHEWQATIHDRTAGRGCPKCAIQKRKNCVPSSYTI